MEILLFGGSPAFSVTICLFTLLCLSTCESIRPNVVIFYADDMGYGDLPSYGHPTTYTPNINKLAENGLVFTQFYASSPICTPSRAGLLTGRYAMRSGTYPNVFHPDDIGGMPLNETTIAEVLKTVGYRTGMIGKWHLGYGKGGMYQPVYQGFDSYYGIPYTHRLCPCSVCYYPDERCHIYPCADNYSPCPLFANATILEQPVGFLTLEEKYTSQAMDFVSTSVAMAKPFFLYFAFHQLHVPIFSGKQFTNATLRGHYGDAMAELDWTVGEVVTKLDELGILNDTFVFFTSDNGPALHAKQYGGSAGLLKCGKGTTYEAGPRVPGIAFWPSKIKPGRTTEVASQLDLLPTICSISGAKLPDAVLDGVDMSSILFEEKASKRESFYYYPSSPTAEYGAYALRYKQYKAHFFTNGAGNSRSNDPDCLPGQLKAHNPPLLFDLNVDPSERFNLNSNLEYAELLATMVTMKTNFDAEMVWVPSQTKRGKKSSYEPCCKPGCTPFPQCCTCNQ